ncbi:MAG: permease prefix domain 1-containing protein, partial [Planctomycetota bacterium]
MRHLATNFLSNLPPWMWPGDDRPPAEIDDEVREELRLHLDLLTEENERRGAPPDEARAAAERRFGDLDLLSRRCRRIKQGDIPMLNRIQVVLTGLLLLAVIFLVIRDWNLGMSTIQFVDQTTASLQTIRSDLAELRTVVSPAATAAEVNPPVAEPADPQAGQFRIAELSVENLQQRCAASKALLEQHTKKLALQRKASAEIESAADREVEQAENKLDEARAKLMKLEVDLRQAGAVIAGVKEDVQAG